jgi:hypothetical protein
MEIPRNYDVPIKSTIKNSNPKIVIRTATLALDQVMRFNYDLLAQDIAKTLTQENIESLVTELQKAIA